MNSKVVIMAGGSGTRLWPMSRSSHPKQFVKIFENKSLFQLSVERNKIFGDLLVVVGEPHKFIAADQLDEIGVNAEILVEPAAKNTAPCALLSALLANKDYNAILLLPADHYITDLNHYEATIKKALHQAEQSQICTIGIKPSVPHTGYGYITGTKDQNNVYKNCQFKEKPDFKTAAQYLIEGGYFWNSGIFACNIAFLLQEAKKLDNKMLTEVMYAFETLSSKTRFLELDKASFDNVPANSIDYTIAERTSGMVMIEADFVWSDLGSWQSLWEVSKKDEDHNHCEGKNILLKDVKNSYIRSNKLTSVIGVENLVIINTDDALLIADKSRSEEVKELVSTLAKNNHKEVAEHTLVNRPWGHYHELYSTDSYKVKHIVIKPDSQISLQYHNQRSEHWIIVSGEGEVTINDEITQVRSNQSVFIPKTATHTIKNISKEDLHMIEVQTGAYFGEDDIVRLKDKYGR